MIKAGAHQPATAPNDRLEQLRFGVRISRGVVTHWQDELIASYEMACRALDAIEAHTGERGAITRVYASLPPR